MKQFVFCLLLGWALQVSAQDYGGTYYGVKFGPSIGTQTWNQGDRDALFRYHAALWAETVGDESSVLAQVGYHVRGSAIYSRQGLFQGQDGRFYSAPNLVFQWNNLALALAMKRKYDFGSSKAYYMFGLRGEYNLSTNLNSLKDTTDFPLFFAMYYPIEENTRKFTGGLVAGGGLEFPFSDLVGGILEISFSPDFTRQYYRPPISNVTDPFSGQLINLQEQSVRNLSVEISLGLRFLRKVEYID